MLRLTRDIVTENLFRFCERVDVAHVLQVDAINNRLQLNTVFCSEHGIRFNYRRKNSQTLECEDCVMAERNRFRCDHCNHFFLPHQLFWGCCGKRLCIPAHSCQECTSGTIFHIKDCPECPTMIKCALCPTWFCQDCSDTETSSYCECGQLRLCFMCTYQDGMGWCVNCDSGNSLQQMIVLSSGR